MKMTMHTKDNKSKGCDGALVRFLIIVDREESRQVRVGVSQATKMCRVQHDGGRIS